MQQMLLFLCLSLLLVLLCKANGEEAAGYLVIEHAVNSHYDNKVAKAFSFNNDSSSIELALRAEKKYHQTKQVSDSLCIGYSGQGNVGFCINESCHEVPSYFQDISGDPRRGIASLSEGDLIVVVLPRIHDILAKDLDLASGLAQSQGGLSKNNFEQWLDETFKNSTSTIILLKYTKHPGSISQVDIGAAQEPILLFSAEQWPNWNLGNNPDVSCHRDDYRFKLARHSTWGRYSSVSATFIGSRFVQIETSGLPWMLFRNGRCISIWPPQRETHKIYDKRFYSQSLALQPNDILIILFPRAYSDIYAEAILKRILEAAITFGLEKVQVMISASDVSLRKVNVLDTIRAENESVSYLYERLAAATGRFMRAVSDSHQKPVSSQIVAELEEELGGPDWAKSCLKLLIQADENIAELFKEFTLLGAYGFSPQIDAMTNEHIDELKAALATNDDYDAKSKKVLDMTKAYLAKLEIKYAMKLETGSKLPAWDPTLKDETAKAPALMLDSMVDLASSYILALEQELATPNDHKVNSEKVLAVADKFTSMLRTILVLPDSFTLEPRTVPPLPDISQDTMLISALTGDFGTDLSIVLCVASNYIYKTTVPLREAPYLVLYIPHTGRTIYAASLPIVADASKGHEDLTSIGKVQTGIKRKRTDVDDTNQDHIDSNPTDELQNKKQQMTLGDTSQDPMALD